MNIKRRKIKLTITALAPAHATDKEVRDFVDDALTWAGGCRCPGDEETARDPMFHSLDRVNTFFVRKKK